jgi:hypothetical protein
MRGPSARLLPHHAARALEFVRAVSREHRVTVPRVGHQGRRGSQDGAVTGPGLAGLRILQLCTPEDSGISRARAHPFRVAVGYPGAPALAGCTHHANL